MPRSKIEFKTNRMDFTLEDVEFTVGAEKVRVGRFQGSLDVSDLLHTRLPKLREGGVRLMAVGTKPIQVVKAIRVATEKGFKESKNLTLSVPVTIPIGDFKNESAVREFMETMKSLAGPDAVNLDMQEAPKVLEILRDFIAETVSKS